MSVNALENITYPDMTTVKGKHKEAYAYFHCTRPDASQVAQTGFEALRLNIWRLKKMDPNRDVVVMVCPYTNNSQYYQLQDDGAIVIPVEILKTNMKAIVDRWVDTATKLLYWKLIGWKRVLAIDIDIYFMDNFVDIWHSPAGRLVEQPPPEFTNRTNETYFGVPIGDLFPYAFAAAPDTWRGEGKDDPNYLNGGLFLLTPSIAHFTMVLNVANDTTKDRTLMDQAVANIAYNRSGPLPWTNVGSTYNWFPWRPWDWTNDKGNHMRDDVKAYHFKFWDGFAASKYTEYKALYTLFEYYRDRMDAETKAFNLLHPKDEVTGRVSVAVTPQGVTLTDKKAYSKFVTMYAIISRDLKNQPSADQIMNGLDASNKEVPMLMATGSDKGLKMVINGLPPTRNHKIYYIKHDEKTDKVSSVGAIHLNKESPTFLEERRLNSAPLISLSTLAFIFVAFIWF